MTTDSRPRLVLRIKSFQSYTTEHTDPIPIPAVQAMIEDYLGRDDDELLRLKAERRPGRPASTRQTLLDQHQAVEQGEYASGFWVPDLQDAENLKTLKEWSGKWSGLATLRFVRISREGVRKESSFPPKGMS
jgi:translation machinery-associated protein 16